MCFAPTQALRLGAWRPQVTGGLATAQESHPGSVRKERKGEGVEDGVLAKRKGLYGTSEEIPRDKGNHPPIHLYQVEEKWPGLRRVRIPRGPLYRAEVKPPPGTEAEAAPNRGKSERSDQGGLPGGGRRAHSGASIPSMGELTEQSGIIPWK